MASSYSPNTYATAPKLVLAEMTPLCSWPAQIGLVSRGNAQVSLDNVKNLRNCGATSGVGSKGKFPKGFGGGK